MRRFLEALAAGTLPLALAACLLFACSDLLQAVSSEPAQDATDVAVQACEYAPALAQSPAIQLEAERLGLDVAELVRLVCESAALLNEWQSAQLQRAADPGAAVVVRLRGAR